jgi:hypothetical protein
MGLRRLVLAGALALCACGASAQEPQDPVQAVMDAYVSGRDYLDPQSLVSFFSVGFTRDLAEAVVHIKEKGGEVFIDWDPISGGQDGCGPKDIAYKSGSKGKRTSVTVTFKDMYCFGSGTPTIETKVIFDLVEEGTAPYSSWFIDDVRHVDDAGKTTSSLREAFQSFARD